MTSASKHRVLSTSFENGSVARISLEPPIEATFNEDTFKRIVELMAKVRKPKDLPIVEIEDGKVKL